MTRSTLKREVWGLGLVKSDAVLPSARHRCNISSKGAVLPGRNDAEMDPVNSLHDSTASIMKDLILHFAIIQGMYQFDWCLVPAILHITTVLQLVL